MVKITKIQLIFSWFLTPFFHRKNQIFNFCLQYKMFLVSRFCNIYCAMFDPRKLPLYNFLLGISFFIEAFCKNLRQTLSVETWFVFFFLFNCIHKKLCIIWCLWYKFDLWSNTCLYLSIYTVLRRNNSQRSWTARVCDSSFVFFNNFSVLFDEKRVVEEENKPRSFWDWFLFNWAKNISIIDLVVEADFSMFLLYRCL